MKHSALLISALALTACASLAAPPAAYSNGILSDAAGKSLYIFKKDAPSTSNCHDGCARAWPPFVVADASKATADYTVVARQDGLQQWAYRGQPLYFYAGDTAPGATSGEGIGGNWYVIRSAAKVQATGSATVPGY